MSSEQAALRSARLAVRAQRTGGARDRSRAHLRGPCAGGLGALHPEQELERHRHHQRGPPADPQRTVLGRAPPDLLRVAVGRAGDGGSGGRIRGLAAVAIAFVAWVVKSRTEERFLVEQIGQEYEEYRQHTRALVPFIH